MRAFDRDLIRGGHYGQRPVCRANRPNTWLHRPACKREEKPCQLGAVHTWHIASVRCDASIRSLSEVERTCCARLDSARFPGGSGLFPFHNLSFSESDFAGLLTALSK